MSDAALETMPAACGRCGNPYRPPVWGREYMCAACGQPLRPRPDSRRFSVSPWVLYGLGAVLVGGAVIQFSLERLNRRLPIVSQDSPAAMTATPPERDRLLQKIRLLEADLQVQPERVALLREACRHHLMLVVLVRATQPEVAEKSLRKAGEYARRLRTRSPLAAQEYDDLIRNQKRLVWSQGDNGDPSRRDRRRRFYEEVSVGGTPPTNPAFPGVAPGGMPGGVPAVGVPISSPPIGGIPMSGAPMGAVPGGGSSGGPSGGGPVSSPPVSRAPVGGIGPVATAPVGMAPATPPPGRSPFPVPAPGGSGGMIGPGPSGDAQDPAPSIDPARTAPPSGELTPQQIAVRQQWENSKSLERELTALLEEAPQGSEVAYNLGQLLERQATYARDATPTEGGPKSPEQVYEEQLRKALRFYLRRVELSRTHLDRATFLDAAANVHGTLGEWEEQCRLLERATKELPYSARLWQELQSVYLRLGRRNESFNASRRMREWTFPTVSAP